jgi:hypothetical protein
MPYIIMKRSDVPAGVLQVLDMDPNTSLRNLTLEPVGQTKYIDPVVNDEVVLMQPGGGGTPIVFRRAANGLAAWIATNVNDGTGLAAVGAITAIAFPAAPGDTFTVDGQLYVANAGIPRTGGLNDWDPLQGSVAAIATEIAAAINDPLNGTPPGTVVGLVTAAPAAGTVTITANTVGTAGNSIAIAEASASLTSAPMAGGADADALTAAEINTSADVILDARLRFGNLTLPALTLTLGDINGALVAGSITAAQLPEVLDILAGRQYEVPNNTQIDSNGSTFDVQPPVGTEGGPGFVAGTLRALFLNDGLPLSFAQGELLGFTDSGFVYGGVAGTNGEAVVVYNDDGTFFTP